MASAASHIRGRNALAAAWRELHGRDATLPELQIAGAMAALESAYGQAPYKNKVTGETRVINNWGAQQSGKPPCGPDGFEVTDVHADGTPYNFCYRVFPATPEGDKQAAAFFVKAVTTSRPHSWAAMRTGDIDEYTRRAGAKDPISNVGLYFEQDYESRAHGLEIRAVEIASSLNEALQAKRGGPVVPDPFADGATPTPATSSSSGSGVAVKVGVGGFLVGLFVGLVRLLRRRKP